MPSIADALQEAIDNFSKEKQMQNLSATLNDWVSTDPTHAQPTKRKYTKSGKYSKTPPRPTTRAPAPQKAEELLSTLSFVEAMALYKKLKQMLGEAEAK